MYPENNWKVLLFSQATRNVDTGPAVVVSTLHTAINVKIYFRKRQSSELSSSVELSLRVSNLLVGLVLGTPLRNGDLGAVPNPAWGHWDGCLFASWTPGVYEGSWGSLNLWEPVLVTKGVNPMRSRQKDLTGRSCSVSYSKEMSNRLVVHGIHSRNPLILCVWKVDNRTRSGSENERCEATDTKNEEPHRPSSKIESWSAPIYTAGMKRMCQIDKNRTRLKKWLL